jgi:hypothetical protein
MDKKIEISLTEFVNFVNKSGSAKATVVKTAKKRREEEYEHYKDYWLPFRNMLKDVHKRDLPKDVLDDIIQEVSPDKKQNYLEAINGYKKFWGRKKIEWVNPSKKTWTIGDLRVSINPELGLIVNDKILVVKLFASSSEKIDKRHANLILTLMEKELREKVGEEPIFAVLDVKRGKLFENKNKESGLYSLLKGEAKSFEAQWKDLD